MSLLTCKLVESNFMQIFSFLHLTKKTGNRKSVTIYVAIVHISYIIHLQTYNIYL